LHRVFVDIDMEMWKSDLRLTLIGDETARKPYLSLVIISESLH
jgi:hypothetical protein